MELLQKITQIIQKSKKTHIDIRLQIDYSFFQMSILIKQLTILLFVFINFTKYVLF